MSERRHACPDCGAPRDRKAKRCLKCASAIRGRAWFARSSDQSRIAARFWPRVVKGPLCWIWVGGYFTNGYRLTFRSREWMEIRPASCGNWCVDRSPPASTCCTPCDNPSCVRPDHLWLGTHADNMADIARTRYAEHRDEIIARACEWARENPDRRRAIAREHSRRFRRAHPERARQRKDRTDFDAILLEHGLVCHICGDAIAPDDLHFDHVVPLSRGGDHAPYNIRPSHSRCNLRKGTKLMEEMPV
jgi:5-methylcytosine-specific restriction endonuclease McrA